MVGATGFEPATASSQSWCSTKLSYAPTCAYHRMNCPSCNAFCEIVKFFPLNLMSIADNRALVAPTCRAKAQRRWEFD